MKYVLAFMAGVAFVYATMVHGYPTYRPYLETLKPRPDPEPRT